MDWLKISGFSGVIAPLVAFTLILFAIASSPDFDWTENALSDLGVQEGVTFFLFNAGLIVGGILAIFFAVGLFTLMRENLLGRIGALVFVLDAAVLATIGFCPENVEPLHLYASVIFFTLFPISMFFLAASFLQMSKMKIGFFTFIAAIVATVVWTFPFGRGVAVPETLSALSASMCSIVLGCKMLKKVHLQTIDVATLDGL